MQVPPTTCCFYLFFCILNTLLTCHFTRDLQLLTPLWPSCATRSSALLPLRCPPTVTYMWCQEVCTCPYVILEPALQVQLSFIGTGHSQPSSHTVCPCHWQIRSNWRRNEEAGAPPLCGAPYACVLSVEVFSSGLFRGLVLPSSPYPNLPPAALFSKQSPGHNLLCQIHL